ncbi:MAG: saccharopine dehydrogenase NADP-binding domain-containing protein [Spirochaetaceae bacterium]|nr:saccharopine dehydrogenase NADP-binding domain-containing protein [Spirochaetaceae bacterium]
MAKKLFALAGAGRICGWSLRTAVQYSTKDLFDKITIGEYNIDAAEALKKEIGDPRVDVVKIDVHDEADAIKKLKGYDVVLDGTTIKLNDKSTKVIAEAGCSGLNLNGFGAEYKYSDVFKKNNKIHVPGYGMTPGITDSMVRAGAEKFDKIDTVRISHCAFRPIAYSPAIFETTQVEYDPNLKLRVVYEDGEMKQVPPFARERLIPTPAPYGTNPQYIIPHSETVTATDYLKKIGKPPRLVEVRGTWPQKNMRLIKALYEWGIMKNESFTYKNQEMNIIDVIGAYLQQKEEGKITEVYGYCLYVQILGERGGKKYEQVLYHTHPKSDGSVKGWEGLTSYIRNVGTPMGVAALLIAQGKANGTGCVTPEEAFDPKDVFAMLEPIGIKIHQSEREIADYNY